MASRHYLSSKEAAKLLEVNESTVKRWADKNMLKCFKTPGGHRKFILKDVMEFSEKYSYRVSGGIMPENKEERIKLEFALSVKDFNLLKEYLINVLYKRENHDKGAHDYELVSGKVGSFLNLLYLNNIPIEEIFDSLIQPVLEQTGKMWEKGEIGIEQEHIVTNIIEDSIVKLQENISKKPQRGLSVLCGCLEGEFHELGIKCVKTLLDAYGWNVYYTGANLPVNSFKSAIKYFSPDLVCISVVTPPDIKTFYDECGIVYKTLKEYGGKLIVGGYAINYLDKHEIKADLIAQNIKDIVIFTSSIKKNDKSPKE